jgi:hypothetical protein
MNAKNKTQEDLLQGARFATSESVADNTFLEDTQKEWEELQAAKVDSITPRPER